MVMEDAKIGDLIMSRECERATLNANGRRMYMLQVGVIVGYTLNCTNEVILEIDWLDFDYNTSSKTYGPKKTRGARHPGNVDRYDEKTYVQTCLFSKE